MANSSEEILGWFDLLASERAVLIDDDSMKLINTAGRSAKNEDGYGSTA